MSSVRAASGSQRSGPLASGAAWVALVLLTLALLVAAVSVGTVRLSLEEVLQSLAYQAPPTRPWVRLLIWESRLPRVLVAWLVGAALSLAGASLQTLFRNPLAEPGVLGVSGSASLLAVFVMYTGLAAQGSAIVPAAATLGALLATGILWSVSRQLGGRGNDVLLLVGVAIGQLAVALTSLIVSLALDRWETAQRLLAWMLGGLESRSWLHVLWGAAPLLCCSLWLLLQSRRLDALLLGDATALSVGVDVPRLRRGVIVVSSLLAGASVAIGGAVPFVGLVVPHVVRRFVGPLHGRLLPASLLVGGAFLVAADLLARRVIAPEELKLGVVTALLGTPLFLHLLLQRVRGR